MSTGCWFTRVTRVLRLTHSADASSREDSANGHVTSSVCALMRCLPLVWGQPDAGSPKVSVNRMRVHFFEHLCLEASRMLVLPGCQRVR